MTVANRVEHATSATSVRFYGHAKPEELLLRATELEREVARKDKAVAETAALLPSYPDRPFVTLDDARRWVATFVAWYNDDHQHSGIRFVTPSERHDGRETAILAHRHSVYLAARDRHPGRWARHTRNWNPITTVRLNPEHGRAERANRSPTTWQLS